MGEAEFCGKIYPLFCYVVRNVVIKQLDCEKVVRVAASVGPSALAVMLELTCPSV